MKTLAQMLLMKSKQSPTRLMGFCEWCEKVYEPSTRMREERRALLNKQAFNMDRGTDHGQR